MANPTAVTNNQKIMDYEGLVFKCDGLIVNDVQIGASSQSSNIADASAVTITDADSDLGATTQAELQGYFNVAVTKINSILAILEANGLMADS